MVPQLKKYQNNRCSEVDADGKVIYPDKQFKGETPVTRITSCDANGTPVTVEYQAVVKEVVPNPSLTQPARTSRCTLKLVPQPSKVAIHWFR